MLFSARYGRLWAPLFIVLTVALAACDSRPNADDAEVAFRQQVRADWGNGTEVRSFEKTDGLGYEKNGIKAYDLEYTSSVDRAGHGTEEVTGMVSFIRTEKGWKVASVSGRTAQQIKTDQRQEQEAAERANAARAQQDIRIFISTLNLYKLDNSTYPSTQQGLAALVTRPEPETAMPYYKPGGYLESIRTDPWGNPYQYKSPGEHGEFDLLSFGSDGKPGGEGIAADIGNWTFTY